MTFQQCAVSVDMLTPLILRLVLVLAVLVHVTFASRAITKSKLCEHLLKMDCARKGDNSICGSDGKIYQNSCFFGQAVCSGVDHGLKPAARDKCSP